MRRLVYLFLGTTLLCQPTAADIVAADNADNDPYPATEFLPGDNGGTGFLAWVELEVGNPGSMHTTAAIDDGSYSWALDGSYALGRGLSNSLSTGTWRLLAVHDPDNTDFSGFNLRSTTNTTGGFSQSELIRFGMDPSQPGYDGSGIHVSTNAGLSYLFLDCGWNDGEGDTIEYRISWTGTGSFSLLVSNRNEGTVTNFSGLMPAGTVAMLGVAVFGSSLDEGITFDDYQVENVIPEPATGLLMGGYLILLACCLRSRPGLTP